MQRLQLTFIE